jgi:hemoglobin/transferrin/lactoferrin receptor protein
MALFSDYQHALTEKTNLKTGVRYNYVIINADFDDTFYDFPFSSADINTGALTGSLGVIYNHNASLQMMVNISTGFRAPNIDDVGKIFDSEPGAVVVPNPDLRSEYSLNTEAGIVKVINQKIKIDLSAYYTNLFNAMVRRDYTFNGKDSIMYDGELSKVQAVQNASKAYVYGIQAGVEWKLPLNLTFSSRINFMKGKEEEADGSKVPLRHATPLFGITHLTYSHNKLELDLYTVYNSQVAFSDMPPSEISKSYLYAKDQEGNPYSPAWYTLNLKSLYRLNDNFILTSAIENITNRRYKPFESGIAAGGINFIFSVKASF